jgi:ribosome biogenesis protein SSF1/2
VKRSLKVLIGRQEVPDLGSLQDVSEFITKSGYGSVRLAIPCHLVMSY